MVHTRPKNKNAHPGVPDQPTTCKPKNMTLPNQTIQRVAVVEHTLMENQQHVNDNARQPPGPNSSEKQ